MIKPKIILFSAGLILLLGLTFDKEKLSSSDTPIAIVKKVVKDVTYRKATDDVDWEEAKISTQLFAGGEVKTGSKSLAVVLFTDGSGVLRVRENSILNIYGEKKDKNLNKNTVITKGVVGFDVNKQSEEEEFKFTTPTAVASIRGTNGFVGHDDLDSVTTIFVRRGNVGFTTSNGNQGNVNGGFTARINPDGSFFLETSTDNDNNLFRQTNRTQVKKLRMRTNDGVVEIEYLTTPEGNQE
ncbi:MAG: FecR family protein [Bacteroidota bacterium]